MNLLTKSKLDDGIVEYRLSNGDLHREDGPALTHPNGTVYWYYNGDPHRVGAPVVLFSNGAIFWYQHGRLHRTDGPAATYPDGEVEYWLDGKEYDPLTFLIKSYEYIDKT